MARARLLLVILPSTAARLAGARRDPPGGEPGRRSGRNHQRRRRLHPGRCDHRSQQQRHRRGLSRQGTPAPWTNTHLGGATSYVQKDERLVVGLFLSRLNATANPNLVLRVDLPAGVGLVEVVAEDGTGASNLGSGASLPSPPQTSFGYFVQGTRVEIYGVPPDGQGGYKDVYLVAKVTAASGALSILAKIDGKVSGNSIVAITGTSGTRPTRTSSAARAGCWATRRRWTTCRASPTDPRLY